MNNQVWASDYESKREALFLAEITKLFTAYNKQIQRNLIEMKLQLISETLQTLKTDKIQPFFSFIRQTEDTFPSDAKILKIFQHNYQRFSHKDAPNLALAYKGGLPDAQWLKRLNQAVKMIIKGNLTPDQAKNELGI